MAAIRHAGEDEPAVRRQLRRAREEPDYDVAWTEDDPLVTVCIPTYTRWRTLVERAIPSVFAQDHRNVEIIVVGDAVGPEVEQAIDDLGDPRVRFENLTIRGPYPEDRVGLWHVGGDGAPQPRDGDGAWTVDRGAQRRRRAPPRSHQHVARRLHGRTTSKWRTGRSCSTGPTRRRSGTGAFRRPSSVFGWQASLQHAAMRLFEYELVAAVFGEPGDWHRVRRMMRAGCASLTWIPFSSITGQGRCGPKADPLPVAAPARRGGGRRTFRPRRTRSVVHQRRTMLACVRERARTMGRARSAMYSAGQRHDCADGRPSRADPVDDGSRGADAVLHLRGDGISGPVGRP